MIAGLDVPAMGTMPGTDDGETRAMSPLSEDPIWTDTLDDMSRVYIPPGGMARVEVSGGDAHLEAGEFGGWIASETITCPPGYRFDLVYLEVDTPGTSSVKVSVLDASSAPTQGGFANITVPGYRKVVATDVSLNAIDVEAYPDIRIQVNLYSDGVDWPRLLAWTVFFVDEGEWRDDLLGTGKLLSYGGLTIVDGIATVRTAETLLTEDDYEPYPPIALPTFEGLNFLYADANGTNYQNLTKPSEKSYWKTDFDDLNGDGYLDLLASDGWSWGQIYWGNSGETYTSANMGSLNYTSLNFATGDFDGDGWKDLAGAVPHGWGASSIVMLNQGDGIFEKDNNISFTGQQYQFVSAGDVNGDGYDDIIFSYADSKVFYGGRNGPDIIADVILEGRYTYIEDVDEDGIDDVLSITGSYPYYDLSIYLGGNPSIDTDPDYVLTMIDGMLYEVEAGDINGDGFKDIVCTFSGVEDVMTIYPGSSTGWDSADYRILPANSSYYTMAVGDINKDGYEDIAFNDMDQTLFDTVLAIAYGGETFPTEAEYSQVCEMTCGKRFDDISIAIPPKPRPALHPRGSITTELINLPDGKKWDLIILEATLPSDTWMTTSVLDMSGKALAGYDKLPGRALDLSGIDPDTIKTIRVKVTIGSWVNTTTPILDHLTVNWMDRNAWRDQFYTTTKVDRIMNVAVTGGTLASVDQENGGPTLVFPSFQGDSNEYLPAMTFVDAGGTDYLSQQPMTFPTKGASAVDVQDIDGDGHKDMVYAVYRTAFDTYRTKSPIFAGTPLGPAYAPLHEFPTEGATDVLLRDLNEDGHWDVVFAQERDMGSYNVDSILFWGSADGWGSSPDVRFKTRGASGVETADLNGDGKLDLVFSCFSDDSGTSTDSLVFLQDGAGFSGSFPSHRLPTVGARAVAIGDLDGDLTKDLVFANNRDGGVFETDSFIYWGTMMGGFSSTPTSVPTVGAMDVKIADLEGDDDLDLVFANLMDDAHDYAVPSSVYLNDGTGGFGSTPDVDLPTTGATAVAVGDVDGRGWLDLVFACEQDGTTRHVESSVYLGGASGWNDVPDIHLPTYGASNVVMVDLSGATSGGYLSQEIVPEDPVSLGAFHTFRYTATMGPSQTGTLQILDGQTWEVLAETSMVSGTNEWLVRDLVKVKAHGTVRIAAIMSGLDKGPTFGLDDLWLNWTDRARAPPGVVGIEVETPSLYRTDSMNIRVDVWDEYDLTSELRVTVEHRTEGSSDIWASTMIYDLGYNETAGTWMATVTPPIDAVVGPYEFRVTVTDMDMMVASKVMTDLLEVLNHLPTAPVIRLTPGVAHTDTTLAVEILTPASDVDAEEPVLYHYRWFRDGVLVEEARAASLSTLFTAKGENWSVEVRAFDGLDEGPPALAWRNVVNAAPHLGDTLPDVEIEEDATDASLVLASAFGDLDGDLLTWSLGEGTSLLTVSIDPDTGVVTIQPAPDWFGEEELTFIASDGEATAEQTVTVTVSSVNDLPRILSVDGEPVTGDTVTLTMTNGETLIVPYSVVDVEDDIIWASVDDAWVDLDEARMEIRINSQADFVGTIAFSLTVWDLVSPEEKVTLSFEVLVENMNDPMETPRITSPPPGTTFDVDENITLSGVCNDPDTQFGQVLIFTWTSNVSGLLGTGPSLTLGLSEPGTHQITLTVTDGEFERTATVQVNVRAPYIEPPPEDDDDTGGGISTTVWLALAIVVIMGVVGALFFKMRGDGGAPEPEALPESGPWWEKEEEPGQTSEPEEPGDEEEEEPS
jgi:hypothetical protein